MDHAINALIRLDAWLERGEGGSAPIDLLRQRGLDVADPSTLADATLPQKLWEIVEAMAEIGLYLCSTDHLSDRELYERLASEILLEETFLDPDDPWTGKVCDLIGGGSEEDHQIFLTYYADEDERQRWPIEFGATLPSRQTRPFHRDRFLPTMERKVAGLLDS